MDTIKDAVDQYAPHPRSTNAPSGRTTDKYAPATDLSQSIPEPGMPRRSEAVTKEKPEGSDRPKNDATALQQHVQFWDFDGDGVIWPMDTYRGFRKLGFNWLISFLAPFFIHGTFSYVTQKSWLPNLLFPIHLDKMHRTKHGSDTEVYDTEGRFVPQKFEEIFTKYDRENKGGLSWRDIQEMVYNNMNVNDPVGWIGERLEWSVLYSLCKNENNIIPKEAIRAQYDGTLWGKIAADVEAKRNNYGVRNVRNKKNHPSPVGAILHGEKKLF